MSTEMRVTDYESNVDAQKAFKALTGQTIRITPFQSIDRIAVKSPTEILVQLTVFTVEERRTEYLLTARGTRLIQFTETNGRWAQTGKPVTVWESSFSRISVPFFGRGKNMAEWLSDREFTRMCGRPGTSSHPLDSHDRVAQGYSTRRMSRHWQ